MVRTYLFEVLWGGGVIGLMFLLSYKSSKPVSVDIGDNRFNQDYRGMYLNTLHKAIPSPLAG